MTMLTIIVMMNKAMKLTEGRGVNNDVDFDDDDDNTFYDFDVVCNDDDDENNFDDDDEESDESKEGEVCTTCVLPRHSMLVAAYCTFI